MDTEVQYNPDQARRRRAAGTSPRSSTTVAGMSENSLAAGC